MASNYFHNDGRHPSTGAIPSTYYQSLLDERHPDQQTSSFLTISTRSDGHVAGQSFHPADLGQSYDIGHFPTRTNSHYPRQGYGVTPDEQAAYSPQFLAALNSGNSVTNLRQPFEHSMDQGISTCATQQHEQYKFNGYPNTSYTSFNSNSFQPTLHSTQPEAISNTADPSMTNAKPHSCPYGCGKSFARKGDMERHARAHGPSSLWCDVDGCNKGFYRKDKLKEHQRKHQRRHERQ